VQTAKFLVIGERQVDVHALQVRPAVPAAIEDAIERLVDDVVLVRPEPELALWIHPRMHGRGEQGRGRRPQEPAHAADVLVKQRCQPAQRRHRAVALHLDHMQRQLVGPSDATEIHLQLVAAADLLQQLVGDRFHREGLGVHDHVLELDTDAFEQAERRGGHGRIRGLSSICSRRGIFLGVITSRLAS
jgi:hypothetical protein